MSQALALEHLELEERLAGTRAQKGLLSFAAHTFEGFQVNWHHRLICRTLNYMAEGRTPRELLASFGCRGKALDAHLSEPHPITGLYAGMTDPAMIDRPIRNVMLACPPRHTKSLIVSVSLPGWWLGRHPDARIIAATYGASLSTELATDAVKVVGSQAYAEVFPGTRIGTGTERDVLRAKVTRNAFDVVGRRGKYRATSVSGALTGMASDLSIIDDPHKDRIEADSLAKREAVWRWYTSTLLTRGQKGNRKVIAATRWSEDDLSGRLLARAKADPLSDQWYCIVLPAILDCAPAPGDPRKQGEALWESEHSLVTLRGIRASQGLNEFEALYQQRPTPAGGAVVKSSWWQFYQQLPINLTNWTISVDLAFKDRNDFCAFQVWACRGADRYLIDMIMERMEFTEQLRTMKALCAKWPQCNLKLVEDAANGAALINTLRREIQGIVPVTPKGSKELRAEAVAPQIESGNVYLPSPKLKPWVEDFIAQWAAFPHGAHDDAVDACSQFLARFMPARVSLSGGMAQGVGKHGHLPDRISNPLRARPI